MKITLPTYDGVAEPKIWLRSLEKIRKAKKWAKAHMVTQAPLLLTGRADEFWETVESDIGDGWDSFKRKIEEEFGEKTEGDHLTDLTKLVREIDEPPPILLWRMEKKFKKAFPSADGSAGVVIPLTPLPPVPPVLFSHTTFTRYWKGFCGGRKSFLA